MPRCSKRSGQVRKPIKGFGDPSSFTSKGPESIQRERDGLYRSAKLRSGERVSLFVEGDHGSYDSKQRIGASRIGHCGCGCDDRSDVRQLFLLIRQLSICSHEPAHQSG